MATLSSKLINYGGLQKVVNSLKNQSDTIKTSLEEDIDNINGRLDAMDDMITSQVNIVVKDTDKVLTLTGAELKSELSLLYNPSSKRIILGGKNSTEIGGVNVSDFLKDNFLNSVEMIETAESGVTGVTAPYLKFTFNTSEGSTPNVIRISVANLIDVYRGDIAKGIELGSNNTFGIKLGTGNEVDNTNQTPYLQLTATGLAFTGINAIKSTLSTQQTITTDHANQLANKANTTDVANTYVAKTSLAENGDMIAQSSDIISMLSDLGLPTS